MNCPRAIAPAAIAAMTCLALTISPAVSSALSPGRPWAPHKPAGAPGTDGIWAELAPPRLDGPGAVYGPAHERMLLFGGKYLERDSLSNDVWEVSLSASPTWTLIETAGEKPAPRIGHVQLYDSRRNRLLVFGGVDSVTRNDFWVLDLTTDPPAWEAVLPTGSLPPRAAYRQAVYDSLNDRVLVFGGADSLDDSNNPIGFTGSVWALPADNPTQWAELTPSGTPPTPRAGASVVYDEPRQRMVLFGGYDGVPLNDAFELSLDSNPAWAPLGATGGPPPARAAATFAHDTPEDRLVLFGGLALSKLSDVWELDLSANQWTELFPIGVAPSFRQEAVGIFDAPRDRMVMFGGHSDSTADLSDPLWALSLGATPEWTVLGNHHPNARLSAASAVDPTRRVMWLHGGLGNAGQSVRSDVWALSFVTEDGWVEPESVGDPIGRRYGHSAIYDGANDRLLFFGGMDVALRRNDVWELTLSGTRVWSELSPLGTPPDARMYHTAVYDDVNKRMVVFGGETASGTMNDVWELSLIGPPVWTELHPAGVPPPTLRGQSGALDHWGNRLILYGGWDGGLSDSVYVLSLTGEPVWERLNPSGTPPEDRQFASMVSIGSRMVITGGDRRALPSGALDDSWLLSLYPPSWRELDVGRDTPPARRSHAAGFDDVSFRLTIFGGLGVRTRSDTWQLIMDQAVPALVSLVSANARAGRVELTWEVSEPLESATVQRSTDGATWVALGSVTQDGSGRLAYVDLDVIAGARYGYRLSLPGGTMSSEAWVEVPVAANFALRGMTPNPSAGSAALVAFTLPDASPARLEVMDIAGRQVFAREVGSLGPGQHFVRVSDGESLAPGVYLVRLTRGGKSLTAKAVTTR